ncbi:Methyltransferase [Flavobacterium longum]|uniref:THUMP-like domain-containing protein n=1 Tax=Flavobacterium longum TaxID=1299340 RepID=UPI0039EC7E25
MEKLLRPEVQAFIRAQTGSDIGTLALAKNPFPDIDWKLILNQIAARNKAEDKLPTWFASENIIWPEKTTVEQTSSEITAAYKARLVSGNHLIDLTGGFGVDDFYFAKKVGSVTHCEINPELSEIAKHNFKTLGIDNISCISGDGLTSLKALDHRFDWIYIDPSRRHDAKGKVFLLGDCEPNVPENLTTYFRYAGKILLKVSPLLDISQGLEALAFVKNIHVVAMKNEVKELLWEIEEHYSGEITVHTVNITKDVESHFSFILGNKPDVRYELPLTYLFEPNAAVMKSGGFEQIAARFSVGKLHRHSHLYTANELVRGFPGRTFRIIETIVYDKISMKKISGQKANVTARNFPEDVASLRKRWKLTDGGDQYYFFTTDAHNKKIVLLCAKI